MRKERQIVMVERNKDEKQELLEQQEESLTGYGSDTERDSGIKRKKHNSGFSAGVFSGAAAALLGICIAGAYLHSNYGLSLVQTTYASGSVISDDGSIEASVGTQEDIIDDELIQKLQILEACVDQYFLFDTEEAQTFKDSIYKAFMDSLDDPYSCYYTAEEYEDLMESTSGSYEGIGVVVSQDAQTKVITMVRPFAGCPGAEAGILPGDILISVDGTDVTGEDLTRVVSWIKGEVGTTVEIRVYRETQEEYYDFTVTRQKIEVPTVEHEMLQDNVGYVQVTEFDSVTADQFMAAVDDLKSQGMDGLVVDIRDNPGGLLNVVVDMLDYLLPEGTIVYTEDKYGEGDTYTSDAEHYFDLPLAVLINGNSASASEIFSGAIQDYGIGTIVGTQSFGKGIVQNVLPFNDGSAIKITVSRYFTPGGTCIHGIGITPDVEVDLNEELKTQVTVSRDEDNQLQEAIRVLKEELEK